MALNIMWEASIFDDLFDIVQEDAEMFCITNNRRSEILRKDKYRDANEDLEEANGSYNFPRHLDKEQHRKETINQAWEE